MAESSFLNPGRTLVAAHVEDGMRVADFGSGSGFFTRAAARLVGGKGLVWAVDAHQDMLSRVKNLSLQEGLHNVEVVHGDIERPKGSHLPDSNFDLVIIANVLFSAEHKDVLAKEAHRILHKGGRALVVDWSDSFGGLGPHPDHVVSAQHARTLFELNGFSYLGEVPAGEYHWGFLVKKQ
ncbi:class I SAM-dependent methyltransferase [Candidatus Kaiserbacteria bacterium]|nr:class I SAM-dependent methyltransferase [Candidatus Kaiserbacteria bacterium]